MPDNRALNWAGSPSSTGPWSRVGSASGPPTAHAFSLSSSMLRQLKKKKKKSLFYIKRNTKSYLMLLKIKVPLTAI